MKIKSILIALLLVSFTTLNGATFNQKGCVGTENPLPPLNNGMIRGMTQSSNEYICTINKNTTDLAWYQTNLQYTEDVGSYANFEPMPRYGGLGKFVNGDYTITGKSILSFLSGEGASNSIDGLESRYISDLQLGLDGFTKNVSTNDLYIPPKLEAEDIVFARAYWSGNIHSNNLSNTSKYTLKYQCSSPEYKPIPTSKVKTVKHDLFQECEKKFGKDSEVDCNIVLKNMHNGTYYPHGFSLTDDSINLNGYKEYFSGKIGENPSFKCLKEEMQLIAKKDKQPIKQEIINNCKARYNNNPLCENIVKKDYYKKIDYSTVDGGETKIVIKPKLYNNGSGNIYNINHVVKYTFEDIKQKCIKEKLGYSKNCSNKQCNENYCSDKNHYKDYKDYYYKINIPQLDVDNFCRGVETRFCKKFDIATELSLEKEVDVEGYCSKHPNDCERVPVCSDPEISQGDDYGDYCSKHPNDCSREKVCSKWNIQKIPNRGPKLSKTEAMTEAIKGYRNMKISAPSLGIKPITVFSEDKDTYFSLTYDSSGAGVLYFVYGASADITGFMREVVKRDNIGTDPRTTIGVRTIKIAGGDIVATDGLPSKGGRRWLNGADLGEKTFITNFGSWSVIVVYNKPEKKYKKLLGLESSKLSSNEKKEYDKYYKPKGVYIYDGFSTLLAQYKKPNNVTTAKATFKMEGFYTPNEDDIDAKLTTYAVSMANFNSGPDNDGYVSFYDTKRNKEENLTDSRGNKNLSGIISIMEPGTKISKLVKPTTDKTATAISTYDVGKYTGKKQTSTYIKYGVAGKNHTGEQSFLNMIAFSTDLYVPNVCYKHDIINSANRVNDFTAIEGEVIRNIVKFENQAKKGEPAEGIKASITLNEYMTYNKNSISINNKPGENGELVSIIEGDSTSPALPKEMVYLIDNNVSAYEKPIQIDKHGNIIATQVNDLVYNGKQLNEVKIVDIGDGNSIIKSDELDFYIGKDGGTIDNNSILGGKLESSQNVFIDFNSTIGKFYKPLSFKLSFSYKPIKDGKVVKFDYNNDIPECEGFQNKKIKVFPLDGLRVVNKNFKSDSDVNDEKYMNLHTQIVNKDFKTKLIYKVDPEKQSVNGKVDKDENGTITHIVVIDEDGNEKKITKEEFDDLYKTYDLDGELELSLISKADKDKKGCRNLLDEDKIPFIFSGCPKKTVTVLENGVEKEEPINCNELNIKYPIPFAKKDNGLVELFNGEKGIKIGYAKQDYEFMISYKPSGLERKNIKQDSDGSAILSNDDKKVIGFGALNKHNLINICGSDVFSVRPHHLKLNSTFASSVRVAGNPNDNEDILKNSFYPVDSKDNYIGGYNSVLGDLSDKNSTTNSVFLIPDLPIGCFAGSVFDPNTGDELWTQAGVPIKVEFFKFDANKKELGLKDLVKELENYKKRKTLDKTYAQIYTDENLSTGVREFNYYNIGDVNLTLKDTTWTYIDQKAENNDSKGCVSGSSSNDPADDPDKLGRVGCDIATDGNSTLKFRHDRIDIDVLGLDNAVNGTHTYYDSNIAGNMVALLDVNVTAYLRNNNFHQNIIPTLYNSTCYARDVRFGLDLNFDCATGAGVGATRCGIVGAPNNVNLDNICANNISDSRCYIDGTGTRIGINNSIIFNGTVNGIASIPVGQLNVARDFNNINTVNLNIRNRVDNNISSAQIPAFEATRAGFTNGINNSRISINFQRATNIANNPIMLYAEDFIENIGMVKREMPLPTDIVTATSGPNTNGVIATRINFNIYNRTNRNGGTAANPTRDVAYFYYGNVNATQNNYVDRENVTIIPDIASMVFCNDNGTRNCTANNSPFVLLQNATRIEDRPNFYQNRVDTYDGVTIVRDFVNNYTVANNDITINRDNPILDNGTKFFERFRISAARGSAPSRDNINVNTKSWFIFDPANPAAIRNTFVVQFIPLFSDWAGQGTTKDGDNVGIFLDNNGRAINLAPNQGQLKRSNRLNW